MTQLKKHPAHSEALQLPANASVELDTTRAVTRRAKETSDATGPRRLCRLLLCMLALLNAPGCISLAMQRRVTVVATPEATCELEISTWRLEGNQAPEGRGFEAFLYSICLYPLDIVVSTTIAIIAPFDGDLEIRRGPLGAIAGIALPGITLCPSIYPPMSFPLVVDDATFERMLRATREGRQADALEMVRDRVFPGEFDTATIRVKEKSSTSEQGSPH